MIDPAFEPLAWSDFRSMDIATQNVLARHFLRAGDWTRLEAAASDKGLWVAPRTTGAGASLDLDMAAQVLMGAPVESLPRWIGLIENACDKTNAGGIHSLSSSSWRSQGGDFGPLFVYFCFQAARALETSSQDGSFLARANALIQSKLPCSQPYTPYHNQSTYGAHAFGVNLLPNPQSTSALRVGFNDWTVDSAAMLLHTLGRPEAFDALLRRSERVQALREAFAPQATSRHVEALGGLRAVATPALWSERPELGVKIIQAARRASESFVGLPAVAQSCWRAIANDPDSGAFKAARDAFGEEIFASWLPVAPADALAQAGFFAERDASLLPAYRRLCFELADPQSFMNTKHRLDLLHRALFDKRPALAREAADAVKERFPHVDNVHAAAGRNLGQLSTHLIRAASCEDPALARLGWDGAASAELLAFPPGRQGLDQSAAMLVARHSSPDIFGSFLDWLHERVGPEALMSQTQAKAWVEPPGCSRKKGDLLAFCVAMGKADHAREILARLPNIDAKSAREVAKAIALSSANSQAGAKALSAWEELLLGGEVGRRKAAPPEPEPPARRPRL